MLAELARAPHGAQRGGDAADDLRRREHRQPAPPRASAGPCRGRRRRGASALATRTLRSSTRSTHWVTAWTVSCTAAGVRARSSTSRRSRRTRAASGSSGRRSRACGSRPTRGPSRPASRTAAAGGRAAGRAVDLAQQVAPGCAAGSITAMPGDAVRVDRAAERDQRLRLEGVVARDRPVERRRPARRRAARRRCRPSRGRRAPSSSASRPVLTRWSTAVKHCCYRQHVTNATALGRKCDRLSHAGKPPPDCNDAEQALLSCALTPLERGQLNGAAARPKAPRYLGGGACRGLRQRHHARVERAGGGEPAARLRRLLPARRRAGVLHEQPGHRAGDPGRDVRRRAVARLRRRARPRRLDARRDR